MPPSRKYDGGLLMLVLLGSMVVVLSSTTEARIKNEEHHRNHTMLWKYKRMCYGIDHPRVCVSMAMKYHTRRRIDLARRMVDEVTMKASSAAKFAKEVKKKYTENNPQYSIVGVCIENFENMPDDLGVVMECMKFRCGGGNNIGNSLSAVDTYMESCRDAYRERQLKSPFDETMRPMQELVGSLFWMADKLHLL